VHAPDEGDQDCSCCWRQKYKQGWLVRRHGSDSWSRTAGSVASHDDNPLLFHCVFPRVISTQWGFRSLFPAAWHATGTGDAAVAHFARSVECTHVWKMILFLLCLSTGIDAHRAGAAHDIDAHAKRTFTRLHGQWHGVLCHYYPHPACVGASGGVGSSQYL
jgi:hypothetical protein